MTRARRFSKWIKATRGSLLVEKGVNDPDRSKLDRGITALEQALEGPGPLFERMALTNNLGVALTERYDRFGDPEDLERAIRIARENVSAKRSGDDGVIDLANLANALTSRFDLSGGEVDLTEAVALFREALTRNSALRPTLSATVRSASILSLLFVALKARHGHYGSLGDLDEAITAIRRANSVATTLRWSLGNGWNDYGRKRAMYLSNLGGALIDRYQDWGNRADLDEALHSLGEAVRLMPHDDPQMVLVQVHHALALTAKAEADSTTDDRALAVNALRTADDLVASWPEQRLGLTLARIALLVDGSADEVDEAVALAQELADDASPWEPHHVTIMSALAHAMRTRSAPGDETAALAALRAAAESTAAPPRSRLAAATSSASWTAERDLAAAAPAYRRAVELLSLTTWRGLDRRSLETILAGQGNLGADSVAACLAAEDPIRAVELAESSRGLLWAQMLDLRTGLGDLAEVDPDLADRMSRVRVLLETSEPVRD